MADVKEILSKMTLEDKCALCSGVDMWRTVPLEKYGLPSIRVSDGPHGMRREMDKAAVGNAMQKSMPSTCFPTAVTVASSWDVNAAAKVAEAIAEEAADQGVDVVLGPGINIKRNPLCGRNFEYFSEDPYLAGELGASYVAALQNKKVGTSLKHFAVNSQEYRRMTISSELDERTLREIYLSAFENTVKKSQPYTIMCSYNRINGTFAGDNKYLLTDILRDEWGYKGIVVSDWGANNDRVQGILAGLDLQMPGDEGIGDRDIAEAVKSGKIKESDLDIVAGRMIEFILRCAEDRKERDTACDYDAHFELAAEIATKGAVLLKNDGTLPLKKGEKIAVVGALAKQMRYQGSGSSQINPYKLMSFTDYLDEIGAEYAYAAGYDINGDATDKALLDEAVAVANTSETVLCFVGLTDIFESEGFDRDHLNIPTSHNDLVNALIRAGKKVVVVLSGGSPMLLPWADKVSSILNMYLAGSAGGKACYKLLFGEANPSGKLPETFPKSLSDNPAYKYYRMGPQTVEYREGIFVGYRYFDTANKEVAYPFGFGLSYTKFAYSDLKLSATKIDETDKLTVSFTVKNVGDVEGEEVAQVYVKDVECSIFREEKALKGFVKVALKPGEEKEVFVELDKRSFAFYNVEQKDWTVEEGEFEILVGASSRDIKLSDKVFVTAKKVSIADYKDTASCYYNIGAREDIPQADFETLLGKKLVENRAIKKGEVDYNATIADIGTCWIGKLLRWAAYNFATVVLPKGSNESMKKMVRIGALDMPLRNVFAMTNGAVQRKVVDGLIVRCNGRPFQGIGMILGGFLGKKPIKKSDIYKD